MSTYVKLDTIFLLIIAATKGLSVLWDYNFYM